MGIEKRTRERLRHHYEVEKELATRLRQSSREQRSQLFRTMYDELFAQVPDHPRLVRRETEEASHRAVESRMALLRGHLDGVETFLELAPGDCQLAFEVCRHVKKVYAVDISDQIGPTKAKTPPNFGLILYDGYRLDIPDESIDLAFSYQFLEHLHPDDVELHFALIKRILRPGGAYIFSTPHCYSGPHDISAYFSNVPEGFHLKEWTYREIVDLSIKVGFSGWSIYRSGRPRASWWGNRSVLALESLLGVLPFGFRRPISGRIFIDVTMVLIS